MSWTHVLRTKSREGLFAAQSLIHCFEKNGNFQSKVRVFRFLKKDSVSGSWLVFLNTDQRNSNNTKISRFTVATLLFPSTQNIYQIQDCISAVNSSIYAYNQQRKFLPWGITNTLEMQYTFLRPSLGRNNINSEAIFSLHYSGRLCTQSIIVSDRTSCWKKLLRVSTKNPTDCTQKYYNQIINSI